MSRKPHMPCQRPHLWCLDFYARLALAFRYRSGRHQAWTWNRRKAFPSAVPFNMDLRIARDGRLVQHHPWFLPWSLPQIFAYYDHLQIDHKRSYLLSQSKLKPLSIFDTEVELLLALPLCRYRRLWLKCSKRRFLPLKAYSYLLKGCWEHLWAWKLQRMDIPSSFLP